MNTVNDNKPRSFFSRLGAELIYKIRGNDSTGRAAWYYLRVVRVKKMAFERDTRKGQIQLTNYGKILMSGYGADAPPEIVRRAREEFGFEE